MKTKCSYCGRESKVQRSADTCKICLRGVMIPVILIKKHKPKR